MVKKIGIIITALLCILVLAGCGCEHVWLEAACEVPKTCELCGETEGEPGEHLWQEATCTAPKTCAVCGVTEGFKLDHSLSEATCEQAVTCEICGYTDGEPLGHDWLTLTCLIVCQRCNVQDPSSPGHVLQEATCGQPALCEACHMWIGEALEHTWLEPDCSNPKHCANCTATEGTRLGHTLADGNDGVSGICTTCGKGVEYYNYGGTTYGWTDYEIASDGSYTNPVTYLLKDRADQTYKPFEWFKNGQLQDYMYKASDDCMAFYAQGKVYYFTSYNSKNPKAVAKALSNAASKYVSWKNAIYSDAYYTNVLLAGDDSVKDKRGHAHAAFDIYGDTYAIVNKYGNEATDAPNQTWAVACDWQK